jgi:hypothetical protein
MAIDCMLILMLPMEFMLGMDVIGYPEVHVVS